MFDLGLYTRDWNSARGARAALFRGSSPVAMTDIGVNFTCTPKDGPDTLIVTHPDVKDQTGQQLDEFPALLRRFTGAAVTDAAKQLVDEQVAAYNEAAKEFTTGPERDFAKHFSSSFLE
ncbi:hypothetical protein MAA_11187 [Metarhizium robertsii ARSEF 23]|nr:uncharacterized protein MAA_11187 [Metarhizium robertsii ARSEF 23]KHO11109.1 hypothetical protein MAA_11187 [Metarhizium robertsii ARSEF 23]